MMISCDAGQMKSTQSRGQVSIRSSVRSMADDITRVMLIELSNLREWTNLSSAVDETFRGPSDGFEVVGRSFQRRDDEPPSRRCYACILDCAVFKRARDSLEISGNNGEALRIRFELSSWWLNVLKLFVRFVSLKGVSLPEWNLHFPLVDDAFRRFPNAPSGLHVAVAALLQSFTCIRERKISPRVSVEFHFRGEFRIENISGISRAFSELTHSTFSTFHFFFYE